ncbi:unnamed protein product [Cuscuta campestris]|uniref:Uncharacterized protein n=1 Tax=Cuscuta campestris TaxID=132261 RepID=A0A484M9H7_9ASTE|nr:unnamed protein product [Cuscuta campestris]
MVANTCADLPRTNGFSSAAQLRTSGCGSLFRSGCGPSQQRRLFNAAARSERRGDGGSNSFACCGPPRTSNGGGLVLLD